MIIAEKEVVGYNKNGNPVAKIIISTELPIPAQFSPEKYKFLKFTIISRKKTYNQFVYFNDIRKALEIYLKKPYDDTFKIIVPCYDITINYNNYVSIKPNGTLILEYKYEELQISIIKEETIKFLIYDTNDLYKNIQMLEKVWETPKPELFEIK